MFRKIVVFEPSGLRIVVDGTTTILDAARRLGLYLPSECGGHGTCGKCLVSVEPAPPPSESDNKYVSKS
ncbi:MAG: 2Fe-2S iron-sulfur cluster-binding protein, partial [Promethearchaeota archaeon]